MSQAGHHCITSLPMLLRIIHPRMPVLTGFVKQMYSLSIYYQVYGAHVISMCFSDATGHGLFCQVDWNV